MGGRPHLVAGIVVVCPGALSVTAAGDQLRATDQADHIVVLLLLCHGLALVENEAHQPPVFFHLIPQALRVVAVHLYIAVKGLRLHRPVEGVVAVLGLVVHQKVAGVVLLEHRRYAVFRIGHQAVAGVVPVQLLLPGHQPPGAVARPVVEQFLSIGGILHLIQLVQRVRSASPEWTVSPVRFLSRS